jgi:DNA/RNA endonuclease G (NUC1)
MCLQHKHGSAAPTELTCPACAEKFKSKLALNYHTSMKHTDPETWTFLCDVCSKFFPTEAILNIHEYRTHKKFTCQTCSQTIDGRSNYKNHLEKAHPDPNVSIPCNKCTESFQNTQALNNHTNKVHRTFACQTCSEDFDCYHKYKYHKDMQHTDKKTWTTPCDNCNQKFPSKQAVKIHKRNCHKCAFCPDYFKTKNLLKIHKNSKHAAQIYTPGTIIPTARFQTKSKKRSPVSTCRMCNMYVGKKQHICMNNNPHAKIKRGDRIIKMHMVGLPGHSNCHFDPNKDTADTNDTKEAPTKFDLTNNINEFSTGENYITKRDSTTRCPKYVWGTFNQPYLDFQKTIPKDRNFKQSPKLEKTWQKQKKELAKWNAKFRKLCKNKAKTYLPDQLEQGHLCECDISRVSLLNEITAQSARCNRKVFNEIERFKRNLLKKGFKNINFITGPIGRMQISEHMNGQEQFDIRMTREEQEVQIPYAHYYIIFACNGEFDDRKSDIEVFSFIIPNFGLDKNCNITNFCVHPDMITKITHEFYIHREIRDSGRIRDINCWDDDNGKRSDHTRATLPDFKEPNPNHVK